MRIALVLLLAGWLSGTAAAADGEQQIVLREYVQRQWKDELISYPFQAAVDRCDPDSVRLNGPDGPMAVQLTDIRRWPGTDSVRSARLWLVADLAPLAENVYTVHYGPAGSSGPAMIGDFKVVAGAAQVELLIQPEHELVLPAGARHRRQRDPRPPECPPMGGAGPGPGSTLAGRRGGSRGRMA